ncbi:hypothetical protein KY495_03660 [Massilia sp. PAMC28688]|uniref:hypothetical protein n=1 Tax=Massilia sp. PAMC28688 TaxID=2861283 RepID=UPI001C62F8D6|nr:hypothetical protein [Massilia sp. PAMC28688]QYF94326.1 hypothetical protein KY495_03660 [Massilia sp. PAMC28688]
MDNNSNKKETYYLPSISDSRLAENIFRSVKAEIYHFLDDAIRYFLNLHPAVANIAPVETWRIALTAHKYGVIYLIDRREASAYDFGGAADSKVMTRIAEILTEDQRVNRLFNFAICAWVHAIDVRKKYSEIRLPKHAFMSEGDQAVFVNQNDFGGFFPVDAFALTTPLYDLHDFVHYSCAMIDRNLYGCKYFRRFSSLPTRLQALVRDAGYRSETPNLYGDGFMFRELSLGLFDTYEPLIDSDSELYNTISDKLFQYLKGELALAQPSSGRVYQAPAPLDVDALAVLSQNKAYEHSASECEEHFFIRSGPGAANDSYVHLPIVERLDAMKSTELNYFERRNFLRHRAQKLAYLRYSTHLKSKFPARAEEFSLLHMVEENLTFVDHLRGDRVNLFNLVEH